MAYLGEPVPTVPQPRPIAEPPGRTGPWLFVRPGGAAADGPSGAVLFGRDGTLLQNVACNGDPAMVHPMAGVRAALSALRGAGFALGVLSNQPAVARGLLGRGQVEAVQARAEALLGTIDVWAVCPHGSHDGCACRMPAPGLVIAACRALGLPPSRLTVVGCEETVIAAALAAGAHAIRVPGAPRPVADPHLPCTLTACPAADGPAEAAYLLLQH
ncbi:MULTISPECIES: HAD-IIIA family hydrolase [Kitasatospora]|uniref:HAD-IIIA family hydrolase n=1 Tax=Kitasatospora cathayae TaxID=3004092 RepID=A0ABY7PVP3_9ACTN|nr:HAD-IIIA family hydrolase [Kitasatospora sp. HUAS 3-15]WBP84484.1 HAD-IIIA family hydrolase [Kitasatospora sp. HUAS 3-15]